MGGLNCKFKWKPSKPLTHEFSIFTVNPASYILRQFKQKLIKSSSFNQQVQRGKTKKFKVPPQKEKKHRTRKIIILSIQIEKVIRPAKLNYETHASPK